MSKRLLEAAKQILKWYDDEEAWVSVEERLPSETGWYKVKTKHNFTSDAPLSRTFGGKLVWVVPDESLITHWREA